MQHVSSSLFPQLQQQREGQAEEKGLEPGGEPARGRNKRSGSSPAQGSTPSSPFPGANSAGALSSSSPFFLGTSNPPRPPLCERRRASAAEGSVLLGGPRTPTDQAQAFSRSVLGSRPPTATPWTNASPAVSPQLLGGHSGPHADVLAHPQDSVELYKTSRKASTRAHLRSLLASSPLEIPIPPSLPYLPIPPSFRKTPESEHSDHTTSTTSQEWNDSDASSFAYGLRSSKPDLRLLKKKSKPSQHLIQNIPLPKPLPGGQQLPSYQEPKVVRDTMAGGSAIQESTATSVPDKAASFVFPDLARADSLVKPLRKTQTWGSQTKTRPVESKRNDVKRPAFSRSTISQHLSPTPPLLGIKLPSLPSQPRQLRFEDPHTLARSKPLPLTPISPLSLTVTAPNEPLNLSLGNLKQPSKRRYHQVTPPEGDSGLPGHTSFHHGDSYFHTFGIDTMYSKEFVPVKTPPPSNETEVKSFFQFSPITKPSSSPNPEREEDIPIQQQEMRQADSAAVLSKKRRSSAIFARIKKAVFVDDVFEDHHKKRRHTLRATDPSEDTEHTREQPPPPRPVNVHVPDRDLATEVSKKRQTSTLAELQAPSYFSRPRLWRGDSGKAASTYSDASSMTMMASGEGPPSAYSIRVRLQQRSSSEHLSPMGMPRIKRVPGHGSNSAEESKQPIAMARVATSPVPQKVLSDQANVQSPLEYSQEVAAPAVAQNTVRFAPQEAITINDDGSEHGGKILKEKRSALHSLFNEIRRISSVGRLSNNEQISDNELGRRGSWGISKHARSKLSIRDMTSTLVQRRSLPKLSIRASRSSISLVRNRLRHKSSEGIGDTRSEDDSQKTPEAAKPVIKPADLMVTHFEQTPFSKRYYDTKKATQQAIRKCIDETWDDDDEGDEEVVLGFELNVPDHLPNSPLCPLHPKHKSGGKAICPLHGIYRKPSSRDKVCKVEIVFDTRTDGEKMRSASMGSDGAGSAAVDAAEKCRAWLQSKSRKSKQRDSEPRGRERERGRCSRARRRQQQQLRKARA